MNEVDDRLAGDPVWELFPSLSSGQMHEAGFVRRSERWLAVAGLISVAWFLYPPLSITSACLVIAFQDFVTGRRLTRSIPDKAGRTVCVRFSDAWAAWKAGWAAFAMILLTLYLGTSVGGRSEASPAFVTSILLWIVSFTASAVLTASGLLAAYRSGMKVWIGEGLNQARMLLLGMLLAGLAFGMLVAMGIWIVGRLLCVGDSRSYDLLFFILFVGWFAGSFALLPVLDRLSPTVVADRPGRFGPKVPSVGKWNS